MAILRTLGIYVLLPCLLAVGGFGTWKQSFDNGLFPQIDAIVDNPNQTFFDFPIYQDWTGVAAIDRFLAVLISFFLPLAKGTNLSATTHALYFGGQGASMWMLLMVEAARPAYKGSVAPYVMIVGLCMQSLSAAVTLPIYGILHLITTPTFKKGSKQLFGSFLPKDNVTSTIPIAVGLGFFVPTLAMGYPSENHTQQLWIVLFQIFPVLVEITHRVSAAIMPASNISTKEGQKNAIRSLRTVYSVAMATSTITHVSILTLSATSQLRSSLFTPAAQIALSPSTLFIPRVTGQQQLEPSDGVFSFMQWDLLTASSATLLWAIILNAQDTFNGSPNVISVLQKLIKIVGRVAIYGPSGAAVALIRERDEELIMS